MGKIKILSSFKNYLTLKNLKIIIISKHKKNVIERKKFSSAQNNNFQLPLSYDNLSLF
jgi:hypothetical protein